MLSATNQGWIYMSLSILGAASLILYILNSRRYKSDRESRRTRSHTAWFRSHRNGLPATGRTRNTHGPRTANESGVADRDGSPSRDWDNETLRGSEAESWELVPTEHPNHEVIRMPDAAPVIHREQDWRRYESWRHWRADSWV